MFRDFNQFSFSTCILSCYVSISCFVPLHCTVPNRYISLSLTFLSMIYAHMFSNEFHQSHLLFDSANDSETAKTEKSASNDSIAVVMNEN